MDDVNRDVYNRIRYHIFPPMWPGSKKMPEWIKTTAYRLVDMGLKDKQIVTILKAMRKARRKAELDAKR